MKILVVDDSAAMRQLIARSLGKAEGLGVEVVEAADGVEALATIAHHGPSIDLLLCNMNMPNVDGLSLLRSLRGSPEFEDVPFVIVTADTSDERVARALREGADGVIGKPFRPEVIAAMVREKRSHLRRVTPERSRDRYCHGNGPGGVKFCSCSVAPPREGRPAC
ncbi:MAG: response regulator [Planctomycetota bacterium]|jgi:two-component system chemotaxis response regulator CheY